VKDAGVDKAQLQRLLIGDLKLPHTDRVPPLPQEVGLVVSLLAYLVSKLQDPASYLVSMLQDPAS
jgi:hypothetical protein